MANVMAFGIAITISLENAELMRVLMSILILVFALMRTTMPIATAFE